MSSIRGRIAFAVVCCFFAVLPAFSQTFHFDQASYSTREGDGQFTIRIVRDPGTTGPASVAVTTACCSNSAFYGSDYWIAGAQFNPFVTIPFAANEMFKDVTVVVSDDAVGEATEFAQLMLSGQTSFPDSTSIAILDNDPFTTFSFDAAAYAVNEHDGTVSLGVTRGGDLSAAGTVQYATQSSSAVSGSDFQMTTGMLSFAAGEVHKTITVPVIDDAVVESNETFNLFLSNPTGGVLTFPANATVTIVDDDVAAVGTVGFFSTQYFVNEGDGSAAITVRRTGSTTSPVTVQYETTNACCTSATPIADFTPVAGTLSFAAGEITKTFTIPIINDALDESTETVGLRLANATGASLDNSLATLSIVDDDAPTTVAFVQLNVGVGEGSGQAVLTVARSGDLTKTTIVSYTTFDGTARNATDYGVTAGSITFAPGETTKTITVPITNDAIPEPSETFSVQVSSNIGNSVAQVTIFDDDGDLPYVTFSQPSYTVREDAGTLEVTVQRTGNPSSAFSVDYSYCNFCFFGSNATADADYLPFAGTLTFAPGEMSKKIVVQILQDQVQELSETFVVNLSNALGATIPNTQASITIIDDDLNADAAYALDPAAVVVGEGSGSVTLFAVRADASAAEALRVSPAQISAASGVDFIIPNSVIQFAAGESRKAFTVSIIDDTVAESDEQFVVQLLSPSSAVIGSTVVTIRDNDAISFKVEQARVVEGDSGSRAAVFTVTPSAPLAAGTTIAYSTADETATAGSDYLPASGTLNWLAGDMTPRTIAVIVNGDTTPENDETFSLKLPAAGVIVHGTIVNDDAAVSISGDVAVKEGNADTTNATFTVTLSPAQTSPVTVGYATTGGSASESDYAAGGAVLTFAPGETQKTITVAVNGDTMPEPNETFSVRLTTATGAGIVHGTATATILDDDDPFTVTRDIEYAFADGVSLKLDLYTPNGTSGPHPLVIWIHGDQWTDGSRFPTPAVREAMRGYAVASIDVRSTNVDIFPAQINDAKAAVRFLRANAARFDLDSSRFAAWGFGSGGHIAALLGTSGDVDALSDPAEGNPAISSRVQAVVSWAAPYDLLQLQNDALACNTTNHNSSGSYVSIFVGCPLEFCGQKAWDASPGKYASKDDPPFLIIHGEDDCEIGPAQATSFARLLRSAKVDVTLKTYRVFGHFAPSIAEPAEALAEVDKFLDAKLPAIGRRRPVMH